jgi:hypothetical protein
MSEKKQFYYVTIDHAGKRIVKDYDDMYRAVRDRDFDRNRIGRNREFKSVGNIQRRWK